MAKRMTVEELVRMTYEHMATKQEMKQGFDQMRGLIGDVLEVVRGIDEKMADARTMRRVDIPELEARVGKLEKEVAALKARP